MKTGIQEIRMYRYLLGDLPEAEATALEQQLFTDDETFEQMWEIENRLVDGYVRGRLSLTDREKFERHYLASPVHRQRIRVAEELIKKADGSLTDAGVEAPRVSWWTKLSGRSGISRSWWRVAEAAAIFLLLMAVSLWLSIDRLRLRREMARLTVESETRRIREQALTDEIAAARNRNEEMRVELERLRGEQNAGTQATPRTLRGIIPFVLSPRLIRGGDDPQSLAIPRSVGVIRLLMRVEQVTSRTFQAAVREVGGRRIWNRSNLNPRLEDAVYAVAVDIPAGRLAPGDYILTLSARDSAGEPEEVNSYYFRIIKQ
jgi:hypothetical protein